MVVVSSMKTPHAALIASGFFLATLAPASALAQTSLKVVASIKPIHSLVAGVMQGVGKPELIVDGASSPHTHHLRPSQARDIQDATIVFWMGPHMEAFLDKPLHSLGQGATIVALSEAPGLHTLEMRQGGAFEGHDHGEAEEHDHDEAENHEHAEAEGHDHDEGHEAAEKHEDGDEHDAHTSHDHRDGETDLHSWLDPENAKLLVAEIAKSLSAADPSHAKQYQDNASELTARLDELTKQVDLMLAPVRDRPFVVFHDAYQYFENRFGLAAAGSITVSPEVIPGAERVAEIQTRIKQLNVTCVFAEPQFEPKLISVVMEGSNAHSGVLDPLGSQIENGSDLYFTLIENMAQNMRDCLSDAD